MLCLLSILCALLLNSCLFETAVPIPDTFPVPSSDRRLDYLIKVGAKGKSECLVDIHLLVWPETGPRIFQAPKYYSDNPGLPVPGLTAANISVTDSRGLALAARDTILSGSGLDGNFIAVPENASTLSYRIDLAPADTARFGIPFPGTGAGVDLIDGAYFFLLPLEGADLPAQWRTPLDIRVEFAPAAGRVLVGSDAKISFRTNYELMFLRAAYDPLSASSFTMRNHEVTTYATATDSVQAAPFQAMLEKCIRVVEDSLLPLPTYRYFVGENSAFYGIEGSQGYWFRQDAKTFPDVHIHELVHTLVGIYNGDLDDPWWKEAMTDYLGNLLALQSGLVKEKVFVDEVLPPRDTVPAVLHYALSAPYVRNHLFAPVDSAYVDAPYPENFIQLVYGKGAQASMILDRYILEHSGRRYSVFNLVRDLNRRHGPAFHRSDMTALIAGYTGGDPTAFLHSLFDQASILPQDSLHHTYEALKAMGRFAPGLLPSAPPAPQAAVPVKKPAGTSPPLRWEKL